MNRLVVSVREAAELLGNHPATVRRMIDRGELEGKNRAGGGFVSIASLEKLTGTKIDLDPQPIDPDDEP